MTAYLRAEGPTWAALACMYGAFYALTAHAAEAWWAYPLLAVVLAFHSSLQHEALHGHPTPWAPVNEALVALPLGLAFPYRRYRETHLAHHQDNRLTDPYDDPESWYVDPRIWAHMPVWLRWALELNNCLIGRMLIGPALSVLRFVSADLALIMAGRRDVIIAWALYAPAAALVVWWLIACGVNGWAYAGACYAALSLISIRSFLEHRAEDRVSGRSAIVECGGLFGLLFLHNNLHAVHHAHPELPWSRIPAFYRAHKARFLTMNGGYFFPSYFAIFARYGLSQKEPAPHPKMESLGR